MHWKVHGQQTLYTSEWVRLEIADVELPDGRRIAHHVVRMLRQSVVVAVVDAGHVLMLWRHRFITNRWGWELPAGWVEPGEDPTVTARREVEEETGWRPGPLSLLASFASDHGISDSRFFVYRADEATFQGNPPDSHESTRVEWIPLSKVRSMIRAGEIDEGAALVALPLILLDSQPSS